MPTTRITVPYIAMSIATMWKK